MCGSTAGNSASPNPTYRRGPPSLPPAKCLCMSGGVCRTTKISSLAPSVSGSPRRWTTSEPWSPTLVYGTAARGALCGGHLRLAEPGDGLLEALFEREGRLVAPESRGMVGVGLWMAHIAG